MLRESFVTLAQEAQTPEQVLGLLRDLCGTLHKAGLTPPSGKLWGRAVMAVLNRAVDMGLRPSQYIRQMTGEPVLLQRAGLTTGAVRERFLENLAGAAEVVEKGRRKGHYRTLKNGKRVWVKEATTITTARAAGGLSPAHKRAFKEFLASDTEAQTPVRVEEVAREYLARYAGVPDPSNAQLRDLVGHALNGNTMGIGSVDPSSPIPPGGGGGHIDMDAEAGLTRGQEVWFEGYYGRRIQGAYEGYNRNTGLYHVRTPSGQVEGSSFPPHPAGAAAEMQRQERETQAELDREREMEARAKAEGPDAAERYDPATYDYDRAAELGAGDMSSPDDPSWFGAGGFPAGSVGQGAAQAMGREYERIAAEGTSGGSEVGDTVTVGYLDKNRQDLQFVDRDYDVREILDYIGLDDDEKDEYDTLFVNDDQTEVWGISGIVPELWKIATRLA